MPPRAIEATKKDYQGDTEGMNEALKQYVYQTEGVADLVGDLLADEQTITRLAQRNESFVKKLLTKIKALANKYAKVDSEATKYLNKLVKSFEKAIDNAHGGVRLHSISNADEEKEENVSIRYSLKKYSDKQKENWKNSKNIVIYESETQFKNFINEAITNKQYHKKMYFGAISSELADIIHKNTGINVEGFNCSLQADEIRKIFKDHGNEETERPREQRAITEDDILNIPKVIQSPDKIVKSPRLYDGKPVIDFSKNIIEKMTVSAIVSDKHLDLRVQTAYVGTKKGNLATPIDEQASNNTPKASRGTVSTNSITENGENVNRDERKSVQRSYNPSNEVDSEGSSLSEAQAEFFKDSKVRDKNGNLLVVYHGSQAQFTEFKHKYINLHGSQEGRGFYFTNKKSMAQGYEREGGQLLKGYLNITKPLSDTEFTLTRAEIKKLLKALDPTGDDIVINYDTEGGMGYPSQAWYNRAFNDALNAIMNYCNTDSEVLTEIRNSGADEETLLNTVREVLGYDGYMVSDKYEGASVFVAFESNQFKNADNKAPTFNPDIRYSKKRSYTPEHQIEKYQKELDNWDRETIGFSFVIGEATEIISNIDIDGSKIGNKQIRIDAAKVKKILSEHQTMSIEVIKELPYLINDPILILDSLTQKGRIILLGEVYDEAGMPVMLILEPNPKTKNKKSTYVNVIKVASAYGKGKLQSLIERSNIKYISKNKNRANNWLKVNRLQLPFPNTQYGSATNSIHNNSQKINTFDENNLDERKSKKRSYNPTENADFEDEGNVWVEDEEDGVKVILSTPDFSKSIKN